MDRSSRSREKKDKGYDYPKRAGSRFESEYSRSYTKPNTSRESPYRDSSYSNLPSPTLSSAATRGNKPQTPYPTAHSSARNFYRSSTAVPASFHTLNTINKVEQILKKSVGLPTNEGPMQKSSQEASARGSALSGANKLSGHLNQMYGITGGSGGGPRSDDNCSTMREGDNTWGVNAPKAYERIGEEVAQGQEKQGMTKEDNRRRGQGDSTKGPQNIRNRASILTKPRSNISINPISSRWLIDKHAANKAKSQKKVRFSENITTHLIPYEERGSQEWRKNILAMNMSCRSFLGYPNIRNLPIPMPLQDFAFKNNRPSTGYDQGLLMPLMSPSSQSRPIGNDWNKGLRDNYGNANSALSGDYQVEPDMNRHFDSGPKNTKLPKSPYTDKGVYNFPTPRRR